ncbi:MAG: hypothetical protein ACI9Y1_002937 [Lentisphaeria bacterium]|jgi:hypothetical protein
MNTLSKRIGIFSLIIIAFTLTACGAEVHSSLHIEDDYYEDDNYVTEYHPISEPPHLFQFHIIDTYGTNTEFDEFIFTALSPYINAGEFEVYWEMESDEDYWVELRINDYPTTDGSLLISSDYCGPYYFCHDQQYQFCEYTPGLSINCETPSEEFHSAYIGGLLYTLPQDLYLILQICDSNFYYCEYETRRVSLE